MGVRVITTETRADVKLTSHEVLAQLMVLNGYSVRSLTDTVNHQLIRNRSKTRVSRSTIGHLRSGYRTAASREVAETITGLFKIPTAALFAANLSKVSRER